MSHKFSLDYDLVEYISQSSKFESVHDTYAGLLLDGIPRLVLDYALYVAFDSWASDEFWNEVYEIWGLGNEVGNA